MKPRFFLVSLGVALGALAVPHALLAAQPAAPAGGAAPLRSARLAVLELASPFGNHMVLQRDKVVPVWGWAAPGSSVKVSFAGQERSTTAGADGSWRLDLAAMPASAQGRDFVVETAAGEALRLRDVLVGEVWLCGGQSNMERQLGPRPPQKPIIGWESAAATATTPQIRQLYVPQTKADTPQSRVPASWTVCAPDTVTDFTAVGYFMARELHARLGVPVGIVFSAWGGTVAEAWSSAEGLAGFPEFNTDIAFLREQAADPVASSERAAAKAEAWYQQHDAGSRTPSWSRFEHDDSAWEKVPVPAAWEFSGHAGFEGIGWLRHSFELPANWAGRDLLLRLSAVDDADTTWVNGVRVGSTAGWNTPRTYRVPASALRAGRNVIAVRVLDNYGNGGIHSSEWPLDIAPVEGGEAPLSLKGSWSLKLSSPLEQVGAVPVEVFPSPNAPTILYNGMIAPLAPYALRGFAFYQGESNAGRTRQYRSLMPALIADWRRHWGGAELPFVFVQIAPYKGMPPEIREAQFLAWKATPGSGLAVTLDCGDADDIHPANKAPVGARLALAARVLAYGESLEYSGPAYEAVRLEGARAVLSFTHLGGGLVAPGGSLEGFVVCGPDKVFYPAQARIEGDTVVVSSPAVPVIAAVRYAWADVPSGTLFNKAGLPASSFRTDVD